MTTSTTRTRARRARLAAEGFTSFQGELSPACSAAIEGLMLALGATKTEVVERAVAALFDQTIKTGRRPAARDRSAAGADPRTA
jgi:hypothetical protein